METPMPHVSPDGLLQLTMEGDGDDLILGFNGFAWTTSSEFLASEWRIPTEAAVAHFVEELVGNRAIIAVASVGTAIRDVWVTNCPSAELKFKRHEEAISFRFWDGSPWGEEV